MNELEERWRELGEFIREQRRVGHLSLRKLSEMAGISNPYLSQIERGLRKPSAEILQQIARALEISSETLYVRAGILDERDDDEGLVAAVRRDPWLTEDQKRTLLQIYESFRSQAMDRASLARVVEGAAAAAETLEGEGGPVTAGGAVAASTTDAPIGGGAGSTGPGDGTAEPDDSESVAGNRG